jgi:hypothetical protein
MVRLRAPFSLSVAVVKTAVTSRRLGLNDCRSSLLQTREKLDTIPHRHPELLEMRLFHLH